MIDRRTAMPERAEIEAVAEALRGWRDHSDNEPGDDYWSSLARKAIVALDRVRDARGDDEAARLRAAAKRVLEADMRGVRDLDALNALEDAAGFSQQGQRRAGESDEGGNQ
jgi:hypothetical protein